MKTIREIMDTAINSFTDLPAVRWLEKKDVKERSYGEMGRHVVSIRQGLAKEGFKGSHIALIGISSISWIEAYLGITTGDNVAVPLDAGLPAEDLLELLVRADAEALFLTPKALPLAAAVRANCPKIKKIWILQEEPLADPSDAVSGILTDLITAGEGDADDSHSAEGDIATIIYTSGTTGKSKGVMLTQKNLAENVDSVNYVVEPGCVMMSVLPIHHAFCLVMDWLKGFSLGAIICINDSYMHMVRNMSIYHPEVILMVPLMIETIYKRLTAAGDVPPAVLAEKVFGGNLKIIFTGGAHLEPFYVEEFEKYGVQVLEGYGMSECSPVISTNTPEKHKTGSIGRPLPNVEVRFENGEILVRGSSVMKGYYQMEKETAETLDGGWLHTGDKGYMDEDGFLFINGRVKNLIILSNGENISPEEIENKLALNPLVGEIIITGENNGLTARIYPDQDVIAAKELDSDTVAAGLQQVLDDYNKNQPTYRQITGLVIRKNPFHRSSTRKIKRTEAEIDD